MTAHQGTLTQCEAIELLEKELDLTTMQAISWLKKNFGAISGMSRAALMGQIDKIKTQLRTLKVTSWRDDEKQESGPELSL